MIQSLGDVLKDFKGTILVLGYPDQGKTTLVRAICRFFLAQDVSPVLVDADLGQSTVGAPGTIGALKLDSLTTPDTLLRTPLFRFIGETSPFWCRVAVAGQTAGLVRKVRASCDVVVVDTSGYLEEPGGVLLKQLKIGLCTPDLILAVGQPADFSFLSSANREKTILISSVKGIRLKSPGERRNRRHALYREYFRGARRCTVSLSRFSSHLNSAGFCSIHRPDGSGDRVSADRPDRSAWIGQDYLCGLYDRKGSELGLGIIRDIDDQNQTVSLETALVSEGSVERVVVGAIRLDGRWQERGGTAGCRKRASLLTRSHRTVRPPGSEE